MASISDELFYLAHHYATRGQLSLFEGVIASSQQKGWEIPQSVLQREPFVKVFAKLKHTSPTENDLKTLLQDTIQLENDYCNALSQEVWFELKRSILAQITISSLLTALKIAGVSRENKNFDLKNHNVKKFNFAEYKKSVETLYEDCCGRFPTELSDEYFNRIQDDMKCLTEDLYYEGQIETKKVNTVMNGYLNTNKVLEELSHTFKELENNVLPKPVKCKFVYSNYRTCRPRLTDNSSHVSQELPGYTEWDIPNEF